MTAVNDLAPEPLAKRKFLTPCPRIEEESESEAAESRSKDSSGSVG